jgi:hypothetical protein
LLILVKSFGRCTFASSDFACASSLRSCPTENPRPQTRNVPYLKRCAPFEKTMKKAYFNLIFLMLIIVLISLFVYSGLEITETRTETMAWKSGKFILTDLAKVIGILLVLSLLVYFFLKKKYYVKNDLKNKNAE